ncbi:MAG: tetratricopeptide repeat protein [Chitinivibrionales bacterium]|nr:tetratricopeptide repeat protein [Chitinivibrionales bacterium]
MIMRKKMLIHIGGLLVIAGMISIMPGCTKARKAGGHMDTPEVHYKQGMKYWDQEEIAKAEEEFKLAKSLDPKFGLAYSGLALTTAKKAQDAPDKDAMKDGFKEAHKLADKGKSLASKEPGAFIAKAMVITMEKQGREEPRKWIRDVEAEYNRAIKLDPQNAEAYYRRGYSYKKAYMFSEAKEDFAKVLELDKGFTNKADREFKLINDIERAAPGTEVGKKIALVEKISRADIAALFVSELKIDKLVEKKRPKEYNNEFNAPDDPREMQVDQNVKMAEITDMDGHWAKNFVIDIVDLNIRGLEPYPDHTFHPQELVSRGEYAMMVEDAIIAITGDESIATKYVGETESRFPDVNPSHPSYNAVCTAADRGIMDAEINGEFGIQQSVTGPEALLVIRKLKNFLKLE